MYGGARSAGFEVAFTDAVRACGKDRSGVAKMIHKRFKQKLGGKIVDDGFWRRRSDDFDFDAAGAYVSGPR